MSNVAANWLLLVLLAAYPVSVLALLGGQVDTDEGFSAVVVLTKQGAPHCSATRIGPTALLTAAHCVANSRTGGVDDAFQTGRRLLVSQRTAPQTPADFIELTIERTVLHPAYQAALRRFFVYKQQQILDYQSRYAGDDLAQRIRLLEADSHFTSRFPDVAILLVREVTDEIPVIDIDCEPLHAGETVQLVGYGYESLKHPTRARQAHPFGRRNWGTTQVIRVDPVNFYTYGGLMRAGMPSLSPGDSGGPVLRAGRVVGVHGTVYGLSHLDAARSNMSVNLSGLGAAQTDPHGDGCRQFFELAGGRGGTS